MPSCCAPVVVTVNNVQSSAELLELDEDELSLELDWLEPELLSDDGLDTELVDRLDILLLSLDELFPLDKSLLGLLGLELLELELLEDELELTELTELALLVD